MLEDDVDVMYVKEDTFEKLLQDSQMFNLGTVSVRVPSIPSLISLKLHAMKSNPDRVEKDGYDLQELLKNHPGVLNHAELEALFT